MSTITKDPDGGTLTINYGVTAEQIAETKAKYAALTADTPAGYKEVSAALAVVRKTRTQIEAKRVALKADAIKWGRMVDSEAKRITALVLEIEEPLREKKDAVDNERQRRLDAIKAEEDRKLAEAEQAKRDAEEAALRAKREEEAERNRIEAEKLAAERKRLDEERAAFEAWQQEQAAERAEAQRKEQAKLDAIAAEQREAQAKIDAENQRQEAERRLVEQQQEAARKAESDRLAAIEFARIDAERRKEEEAKRIESERLEAERLERLKPDSEKLHGWARLMRTWLDDTEPTMATAEGKQALSDAQDRIIECVEFLITFGK